VGSGRTRSLMAWQAVQLLLCLMLGACAVRGGTSSLQPRAEATLRQFLLDLHEGRYQDAAKAYGGSYGWPQNWNPGLSSRDHVALLRNGCTINGLQCYPVLRVVSSVQVGQDEVRFEVELAAKPDSALVLGPCCGETGDEESQFRFSVRRRGSHLVVMDLPPLAP
jgi:hypothetical protein